MTRNKLYDSLFQEYLRVCNEAFSCNRHCFPYNRIMYQVEDLLKDHSVQVAIYDQDASHPEARYDMTLQDGKLTARPPHRSHAKNPWKLTKYFLEQVTQNPHAYICNPAQLDWKWLTDHQTGR